MMNENSITIKFTKLEKSLLEMLLDGDDEILVSLREQLISVTVSERETSRAGFFTTFHVVQTDAVATNKSFKFGDVHAKIHGLEHGAGFLLYVKKGMLEMLEAYSYDEQWPNAADNFELSYINGQRDFEKLKSIWS